jgi:hypothetical protein
MMYDSVRQAKPAIRSTFGVGRYNTRLNFYIFEASRIAHIQRKSFSYHRQFSRQRYASAEREQLMWSTLDSPELSYVFVRDGVR